MKDKLLVCIIDYGLGNIASVKNAFDTLGVNNVVSNDPIIIRKATHLVLIGVGSFKEGMSHLKERGLVDVLRDEVMCKKKNILGICLGMQLFATKGFEHGENDGLNFIPGKVIQIDVSQSKLRLPHVGWNNVKAKDGHQILNDFVSEPIFYFVHSFHFVPDDERVIVGFCDYGVPVTAIIESGNIFGTQFHPEKSSSDGLQILKNFINT
jgi:glutamine amidotransferase